MGLERHTVMKKKKKNIGMLRHTSLRVGEDIEKFSMGIFIKMVSRKEGKFQALLESDIILLVFNYSV